MADNTVVRGDSGRWFLAFTDPETGGAYDLTGCTVWFTAKASVDADANDNQAVVKHFIVIDGSGDVTSADGLALGGEDHNQEPPVVVTEAADGVLTQTLAPADSTGIAPGSYVYDVQIQDANGDVWTPVNGLTLTIEADVTRRTTTP